MLRIFIFFKKKKKVMMIEVRLYGIKEKVSKELKFRLFGFKF